MGLVDYSSGDSDSDPAQDDEQAPPPSKRPRTSATPAPDLPPLPSAFHNLYATTVRPFTADLSSLHQGRKRLIPHVDGHWPSHIYVEWHPSPAHQDALTALLCSLQRALQPLLSAAADTKTTTTTTTTTPHQLTTFLTSDLGAPRPLHISLSRPFVLRTEQKGSFRDALANRIASAAVTPFALRVVSSSNEGSGSSSGLAWFRSTEAARSFLVLRVCAAAAPGEDGRRTNPQLAALLDACNEVVAAHGQPRLYARRRRRRDDEVGGIGDAGEAEAEADGEGEGVQPVEEEGDDDDDGVDGAFHVSIAWTFANPTEEIRARTAAIFAQEEEGLRSVVRDMRILVDGVKVKLGNVVTDLPLAEKRTKNGEGGSGVGKGLFGI